jgi:mannitol/fructose-specific phosphotransferase system IIA component (Ntr-type)
MQLTDIVTLPRIKVPLAGISKDQVIEELVELLGANGDVMDRDSALHAVLERENTRTTGIGNGLAIPHGKCAAVRELVMAVGKPAVGVDFDSIDGKPVTVVALLLGPVEQVALHIQALARISRLFALQSFRKQIDDASTAEAVYSAITEKEREEAAG